MTPSSAYPAPSLTGLDTYAGGIKGYGGSTGQHDVTVRGFVIEHFLNGWSDAGFRAAISHRGQLDHREQCDPIQQHGRRFRLQPGSIVRGNNIHHNGRIGITGGPVNGS